MRIHHKIGLLDEVKPKNTQIIAHEGYYLIKIPPPGGNRLNYEPTSAHKGPSGLYGKSETRDVPTNLGGTKNKAHTGTDK